MNQRILITGGTGLLGSYLLRWFRQQGYTKLTATYQHNQHLIPADLRDGIDWRPLILPDLQDTDDIIKGQDWIIHAAGFISYNKSDRAKLFAIHQEGTKHIVNACLAYDVKHLVYISSIGVLGKEKKTVTLNETTPWIQNEFSTTYGLSKYLGELEAWRGATEGLPVTSILPSVILGTGDWHRSSLQIFDRVATKSGLYPGGQTGYVDVRDVVKFIGLVLEKNKWGERWILNGDNITYEKIYKLIGDAMGLHKSFRLAPRWLARLVLSSSGIFTEKKAGLELLNHAYGTFTYDNRKSLEMEEFSYRSIDETIRDIVEIYKSGDRGMSLKF